MTRIAENLLTSLEQAAKMEKETMCLDLLMELTQMARQDRQKEYRAVRKKIMKLYHEDKDVREFFQKSLKSLDKLNIPRE